MAAFTVPDALKPYTVPNTVSIAQLECREAFDGLTPQEKQYALGISDASWQGAKICLLQTSVECVPAFALLQHIFADGVAPVEAAVVSDAGGVSKAEFDALLTWAAAFYGNMGNYRSFGDTKILPALPRAAFARVVRGCPRYAGDAARAANMDALWAAARRESAVTLFQFFRSNALHWHTATSLDAFQCQRRVEHLDAHSCA